jgi:hypothetical protein
MTIRPQKEGAERGRTQAEPGWELRAIWETRKNRRLTKVFDSDNARYPYKLLDFQHPPRIFEQNLPRHFLTRRYPPDRRKLLRPAAFFAFAKTIIAIAAVE